MLRLAYLTTLLVAVTAARWGVSVPERSGRQLLDISFNATGALANSTLQVFALANSEKDEPCIFQGYPGSRADLVVPGPLVVNVPVGTTSHIKFGKLTSGAIVALYNQTANNTLTTSYNATYGLYEATFKANDSSLVGSTAYITAGRVDDYNNSDPDHSWNSPPSCLVNVTFVVVPYIPPPSPAPMPPAAPKKSPSKNPADFLSGLFGNIPLPKNPCFCTPIIHNKATCFNFNQAASDTDCKPDSNLECTSKQAPAGLFTQGSGPVYDCKVAGSSTAG